MTNLIPYGQIRWVVDRLSVGATPDEVTESLLPRLSGPDWTDERKDEAIRFALLCHEQNRQMYERINRFTI